MKKASSLLLFVLVSATTFAGGLLTNSNQSTQYVRTLSRNASTDVDATYFNPAGLSKLDNGFYLTIDNQSIFQTKTITNDFYLLNSNTYEGKVNVPLFPTGFAVYKMDKLAFSLGFGPNAGGGSATFNEGLPSFEIPFAKNIAGLADLSRLGKPVDAYSANIHFEGASIFWGIQFGVAYKINDMISVYGGARYMPAKNTYSGYIKDIKYGEIGALQNGQTYLGEAAAIASALSAQSSATAASLQQVIDLGGGNATIAIVQGMGLIDATIAAQLQGGLSNLGLTSEQISAMNFTQIQGAFVQGSTDLANKATLISAGASQLGDKEVEVTQTGTGITPIIGLNLSPVENLNIGIKYEFLTKLELTNNTTKDDVAMFPDGAITHSDVPAILSIGAEYKIGKLSPSISYNQYFDKQANWGGKEQYIDHGLWELGIGLEYDVTDNILLSGGFLHAVTGVQPAYQSDMSYSNSSNTVGLGCQIGLTSKIDLNLGALNSFYIQNEKQYSLAGFPNPITETYTKSTMAFSIGLDIKLF